MKTKYRRTMHFQFSPGTTSDDRITDDHSFLENTDIVMTEKLDGQNNSICKYGVYARSHGAFSHLPWDEQIWNIHAKIKDLLDDDLYLFGENMYAIHSIEYLELKSYYYLFAVRKGNEWLSWDDVEFYADLFELPTVPLLFKGKTDNVKKLVLDEIYKPSLLKGYEPLNMSELASSVKIEGKKPIKEGVVVRKATSFIEENEKDYSFTNLLKWVRKDHVKTDQHWTKNWRVAQIKY